MFKTTNLSTRNLDEQLIKWDARFEQGQKLGYKSYINFIRVGVKLIENYKISHDYV